MTSRRAFLQHASAAAALGLLAQLPGRRLWATTPIELLPDPDEAHLRELALKALDAARAAGADFADVRLSAGRWVGIECVFSRPEGVPPMMRAPVLVVTIGYGVRVLVDGAWGFASGSELTAEAVSAVARAAVARARANRPRRPRTLELAPTPVVRDGRWTTPITQDPFTVSVGAQADLQLASLAAVARLAGMQSGRVEFNWQRTDRVFASTEDSLLVQRVALAFPSATVTAQAGDRFSTASEQAETLREGGYGYESVGQVNLVEELRHAAERAVARSRTLMAPSSAEVGRYDLVLSAEVVAQLLAATVAEAVNAERALGYHANREGTSFAAPPGEVLGKYQVGSKLLTMRADRTRPYGAATLGWDDEGAPAEEFTIVQDGVIVDYHTTRQTAAELTAWYRAQGDPVRSHGCASGTGRHRPTVQLPNLTLAPATSETSIRDLIADTRRGFYIERCSGSSDQQLLNGQFATSYADVWEIRNGRLGGRIGDLAFQFLTPQLWKSVDALGGPASAKQVLQGTDYLYSRDQLPYASVSAVPARVRQVNVLNVGRTV